MRKWPSDVVGVARALPALARRAKTRGARGVLHARDIPPTTTIVFDNHRY